MLTNHTLIKAKKALLSFSAIVMLAMAAVLALSPLASAFEGAYSPESGSYNIYQDGMALVVSGREAPDEQMDLLELDIVFPEGADFDKADINLNPVEGEGVYTDTTGDTYQLFVGELGANAEFTRTCDVGTWRINFGNAGALLDGATIHMAIQGTGDDAYTIGDSDTSYLWGNMSSGTYPEHEGYSVTFTGDESAGLPNTPSGHLLDPNCEESADDEEAPGVPNTSSADSGSTMLLAAAGVATLAAGAVVYRRSRC